MIRIIEGLIGDWWHLEERIEYVTTEIEVLARGNEGCRQLMTVPGIGPIIASAMVAAIGNGTAFAKGRDFAAWLGLVPKQMSTGDRTSSAALQSAETAICARSSCKAPALFCSDRQTGQSTASDRGSQPRRNACITMFWQPHWPTN
jgi:transposase